MYDFCDFCASKKKVKICGYKSDIIKKGFVRVKLCAECIAKEPSKIVVRGAVNE